MNAPGRGWSLSRETFCLHLTWSRTNLLVLLQGLSITLEWTLLSADLKSQHPHFQALSYAARGSILRMSRCCQQQFLEDSSVAGGNHTGTGRRFQWERERGGCPHTSSEQFQFHFPALDVTSRTSSHQEPPWYRVTTKSQPGLGGKGTPSPCSTPWRAALTHHPHIPHMPR